ncbi:MAG: DUF1467 family protein [Alphaproteobacteria bacterium]|nr:DUF1467 family protein [Alphaproteobacteria bacterium]
MGYVSGIVVYVMIWWVVLFCVLPFGMPREFEEQGPNTAPGAPPFTNMKNKIIITSLLALVLWGVADLIISSDLISFREMANE